MTATIHRKGNPEMKALKAMLLMLCVLAPVPAQAVSIIYVSTPVPALTWCDLHPFICIFLHHREP